MKKITATLVVAGVAAVASAQTSVYYLSDGEYNRLNAYQGGVQQWDQPQAFGFEAPLAIVGSEIRTVRSFGGQTGGQYDLNGNFMGATYTNITGEWHWDSTSDNTSNYLVGQHTGNVYATDTSYQNPVVLFTIGSGDALGITYDPTNNSLWIADWTGGRVTNYGMDGTELSSFNSGLDSQAALALDPADGTLWMIEWGLQTAYQWDKAGNSLGSFFDAGMTGNPLGGEFMIPAPGSLALLGLGGLLAARRRR